MLEAKVRENLSQLQNGRAKAAVKPAGKAVDVSADDFDEA